MSALATAKEKAVATMAVANPVVNATSDSPVWMEAAYALATAKARHVATMAAACPVATARMEMSVIQMGMPVSACPIVRASNVGKMVAVGPVAVAQPAGPLARRAAVGPPAAARRALS